MAEQPEQSDIDAVNDALFDRDPAETMAAFVLRREREAQVRVLRFVAAKWQMGDWRDMRHSADQLEQREIAARFVATYLYAQAAAVDGHTQVIDETWPDPGHCAKCMNTDGTDYLPWDEAVILRHRL